MEWPIYRWFTWVYLLKLVIFHGKLLNNQMVMGLGSCRSSFDTFNGNMARLWSDAKRTLRCAETHDKTVKNDAKAFNEGSISKTISGEMCLRNAFWAVVTKCSNINWRNSELVWMRNGLCALLPIAYLALLTGLSVQKGQFRLLLE